MLVSATGVLAVETRSTPNEGLKQIDSAGIHLISAYQNHSDVRAVLIEFYFIKCRCKIMMDFSKSLLLIFLAVSILPYVSRLEGR